MTASTAKTRSGGILGVSLTALLAMALGGCNSSSGLSGIGTAEINNKTKFSVAEYGVAASPRVTTSRKIKKGGGREMVGKPYRVRGKWYEPKEEPGYDKAGLASWYGPNFHGRLTANGEIYDQYHLSAAHPTFPLPSYARVTNKKNGRSVIVRVNDRGPYAHGRIIDVSSRTAELLEMKRDGVAAVRVQYVGRAPVEGDDTRYLLASYRSKDGSGPPLGEVASGVMLAMNGPAPSALLPGVATAAAATALPPAAIAATASPTTSSLGGFPPANAPLDTGILPASFALPEIGPVLPDRPSLLLPVAALGKSGFTDIGLAYRGGRVTQAYSAFDRVLRPGRN